MAAPGLVAVMPGSGVMRMPPVSVCHQVSTMGQRSPPMWVRYQIQASGLMGSPTDPRRRRLERSCEAGQLLAPLHEGPDGGRRGVEDVDLVLLDEAATSGRAPGVSGVPSYMTEVVPLASGP